VWIARLLELESLKVIEMEQARWVFLLHNQKPGYSYSLSQLGFGWYALWLLIRTFDPECAQIKTEKDPFI
jgi:hypothetical protein